ncbi:hypothetical protein FB563_5011 [Streptomyces puniciscabiei]|uniref:Uncharacterized protein n=1 Tax=Streptomyces puniciscabiei TaxID=164348 RepID=A0A542ULG2_9ACTN|nr:hypothetical protein FB563_5011 [Streptomyces puniciscabiei]
MEGVRGQGSATDFSQMLFRLSYIDLGSMTGVEPVPVRSDEVTAACAPDTHHELRLPRSDRLRLFFIP